MGVSEGHYTLIWDSREDPRKREVPGDTGPGRRSEGKGRAASGLPPGRSETGPGPNGTVNTTSDTPHGHDVGGALTEGN